MQTLRIVEGNNNTYRLTIYNSDETVAREIIDIRSTLKFYRQKKDSLANGKLEIYYVDGSGSAREKIWDFEFDNGTKNQINGLSDDSSVTNYILNTFQSTAVDIGSITVGDIAIGAVELKDADSSTRATIKTDGEDNALVVQNNAIGNKTDSAATTDTGNFSEISLLKRQLQKLTALILQLPATLGSKTGANSLSITLASDQIVPLPTGAATEAEQEASNTLLDSIENTLIALNLKINTLGQKTKANSQPVTLASDEDLLPLIGAVSETAPASDTANAGLNGRLKRVAQNITTLNTALTAMSGKLPASLGKKAATASLSVTLDTNQLPLATSNDISDLIDFINVENDDLLLTLNSNNEFVFYDRVVRYQVNGPSGIPLTDTETIAPGESFSNAINISDMLMAVGTIGCSWELVKAQANMFKNFFDNGKIKLVFFKAKPTSSSFTPYDLVTINDDDARNIVGSCILDSRDVTTNVGRTDETTSTTTGVALDDFEINTNNAPLWMAIYNCSGETITIPSSCTLRINLFGRKKAATFN